MKGVLYPLFVWTLIFELVLFVTKKEDIVKKPYLK